MLRQKNKFLFVVALCALIFSTEAFAKRVTFGNRSAFGLGFLGGLSEAPEQTFTASPQTQSSSYSKFYGVEPFLDFGNFSLRAPILLHQHPLVEGSGQDLGQNFNESSDASNFSYGIKFLLTPYRSKGDRARIYFGAGAGISTLTATNTRNYLSASGATTTTNAEKVRGSSQYLEGLLGVEFFIVQNYSLSLETGYRSLKFDDPEYANEKNVRGQTVNKGDPVKEANGTVKSFTYSGFQFSLGFNLHF